jgi:hypothetical protein
MTNGSVYVTVFPETTARGAGRSSMKALAS